MKLIFLLFGLLIFCTPEQKVALVHTGEVRQVSNAGVLFAGFLSIDGTDVIEYGFVWSFQKFPTLPKRGSNPFYQFSATVGTSSHSGEFETFVDTNLVNGFRYNLRAYAILVSGQILYGETVNFLSEGIPPPIINSFSPVSGVAGDVISIDGDHFTPRSIDSPDDNNPNNNTVIIGIAKCKVISATRSQMTIQIPNVVEKGAFPITISVLGQTGASHDLFTLE